MNYKTKTLAGSFMLVVLFLYTTISIAQTGKGEIDNFEAPPEAMVYEPFKVITTIENTDTGKEEYKLVTQILREGRVVEESTQSLELREDQSLTVVEEFVLTETGKYEIVTKLYGKLLGDAYDTIISSILVNSRIGPFDMEIDTLSGAVALDQQLPVIVKLDNKGVKGSDVDIAVTVECLNNPEILTKSVMFVEAGSSINKMVKMPVCRESGLHRVRGEASVLGITLVSASTQFFVIEKRDGKMNIEFPGEILANAGEPTAFSISVQNPSSSPLENLRLVIEGVPSSWVSIKPSSVSELRPNEKRVFIVNITAPIDAKDISHPIMFLVGAEQALQSGSADLVIRASIIPPLVAIPWAFYGFYSVVFLIVGYGAVRLAKGWREKLISLKPRRGEGDIDRREFLLRLRKKVSKGGKKTR